MWDFPKIRVPYFGVLMVRILLFKVLCYGKPLCGWRRDVQRFVPGFHRNGERNGFTGFFAALLSGF